MPVMKLGRKRAVVALVGLLAVPFTLVGCNSMSQTITHGYQIDEESLALVPEGSSREQVLLTLGTPSTTNTLSDAETFYYISQKKRKRVAFANGKIIDQRVLAVYMDQSGKVSKIADYGLKDGRVFDFKRRITPTGGADQTFLSQLLKAGKGGGAPKSIFSGP